MSRRWISFSVAALVVIACAVWLVALRSRPASPVVLPSAAPRAGALPVMFEAPSFALPDQDGQTFSRQDLRGRVWIVDFIFTSCAHVCPRMTARRVELQQRIADPRVAFLSFSVDPERDDAARKKAYAKEHGVDESRWRFVTPADRDAAMQLARSMKIAGPPKEQDNPILHADRFLLLDSHSRVRGTYHLDDPAAMQRLVEDAQSLANAIPPAAAGG